MRACVCVRVQLFSPVIVPKHDSESTVLWGFETEDVVKECRRGSRQVTTSVDSVLFSLYRLMSPETRVIGLYFCRCSMGLSSFIFCGGLRKTHRFYNRVRIGHSKSSKVVDFGTNRKGVCDFLLVINSNFGPILHRF